MRVLTGILLGIALATGSWAAEEGGAGAAATNQPPRILVIVPERIDTEWFWYFYSDTAQHLVQSAIEKVLLQDGYDVVDISAGSLFGGDGNLAALTGTAGAVQKGRAAGATLVIAGTATAMKASEGSAYGVNVVRSSAEITARIIRVSDGKVLAVEEASAQTGGQSQRAAGQEALKEAGKSLAKKLASSLASSK